MKNNLRNKLIIAGSIIIITLLHYFTLSSKWEIHDFYRRLYYIPIIFAAFNFKLKGGIVSSIAVAILYAPHLLLYFGEINLDVINQFLEIAMFIIIGTMTGTLVQSESKAKHLLESQIMKLTNLENYTHNILDSILNGVIAVDKNLQITSINKEGQKLLTTKNNYCGKQVYNFFVNHQEIKVMLTEVLKYDKRLWGYETACFKKDGTKMPVRLYSYPLKNILNRCEGLVLVIEDISQVKRLESQIRRTEKLSALGELASGVAHEIRNPLAIIKTISQVISKDIEDEEIREGHQIIQSEIDRANRVVQELLDFAKPNVLNNKIQSIDQLIRDILILIAKYAQQHKVEVHYTCLQDSLINTDETKLKQAFINIIFNSIQAMPLGGNLYLNLTREGEWMVVSFTDEGVGIEEEKLEKIFEPFYTTKEKGTGLGLSITHRIIEEHKGYLEISSKIGAGTTIQIYLPNQKDGDRFGEEDINC